MCVATNNQAQADAEKLMLNWCTFIIAEPQGPQTALFNRAFVFEA